MDVAELSFLRWTSCVHGWDARPHRLTFHISKSSSSTLEPGNIGRPQAISKKIHPTPLENTKIIAVTFLRPCNIFSEVWLQWKGIAALLVVNYIHSWSQWRTWRDANYTVMIGIFFTQLKHKFVFRNWAIECPNTAAIAFSGKSPCKYIMSHTCMLLGATRMYEPGQSSKYKLVDATRVCWSICIVKRGMRQRPEKWVCSTSCPTRSVVATCN